MSRLRATIAFVWLAAACAKGVPPMNYDALAPCPKSPNCVSTEAMDEHRIQPFRFTTSAEAAKQRLLEILHEMPRTRIVSSDGNTIRAEFTTRIFRFVDDGVFVVDDGSKTIRFRSASRVGHSDLGVNRKRMEKIRGKFER